MRKYEAVMRVYMKTQFAWRADAVSTMIAAASRIIFAALLWGAIYKGGEQIAGFTYQGMITYYVISSFLTRIDLSGTVSREISSGIRRGTFSKYITMPVDIERYFLAMEGGLAGFHVVFTMAAIALTAALTGIRFQLGAGVWMAAAAVCLVILGLLFMARLNIWLGILTMRFQEIGTFLIIKDNLVAAATGAIIPLVLLPGWALSGLRFTPFYGGVYLPAMLLMGRCGDEVLTGIFVLLFWNFLMKRLLWRTYRKYRSEYDGVGI